MGRLVRMVVMVTLMAAMMVMEMVVGLVFWRVVMLVRTMAALSQPLLYAKSFVHLALILKPARQIG